MLAVLKQAHNSVTQHIIIAFKKIFRDGMVLNFNLISSLNCGALLDGCGRGEATIVREILDMVKAHHILTI
jgi:hypothetical protein